MPDATGALTDQDRVLVRDWFSKHWKNPVICPVCKGADWTYGTHVVRMARHAADAFVPGTSTFPYLPVACNTCAHTIFFGTVTMGVTPPYIPPPPPPPIFPPLPPLQPPNAFNALLKREP